MALTEAFCSAVAAGEIEKAQKLLVAGTYSDVELRRLKEILPFEEAKAHVGTAQFAMLTNEIAARGEAPARAGARPRKGRWGVSLQFVAGNWLIRDLTFIPNEEALSKYLEQFRKSEPQAKKIVVAN